MGGNSNLFYETYGWSFHIKFPGIFNELYSYIYTHAHIDPLVTQLRELAN